MRTRRTLMTALAVTLTTFGTAHAQADLEALVEMAPYRGYLAAHAGLQDPPPLLGGPVTVEISQDGGGVFVGLPDERELDPDVFGTPEMPRAFAGTPGINGVPPPARGIEGGRYTEMKTKSPFGDAHVTMGGASLSIDAVDATAVDGANSDDRVSFQATWEDDAGNAYAVRCCEMLATRGVEFPTFGGVVTNHVLHGSTRIGTALMPTEYVYFAFWGMGEVLKNGEVVAAPRLVHGMLTEYVRAEGYSLASDREVTPNRTHFHLMVPPMRPDMEAGRFVHEDVPTGFTLPNGMELPFWHVMFENLDVRATRGGGTAGR
ncbi:MAG: hypothetical protein KY397_04230 [Gemmatimonadetes bacterium]|nr:hypothetical protein [Gemmatimonadota bacterium]